jgi:hypothetical protein
MKSVKEIETQKAYLDHGYNYIVVFTDDYDCYETAHFKSRRSAEMFNENKLSGFGEVMTVHQAVKKYDFLEL